LSNVLCEIRFYHGITGNIHLALFFSFKPGGSIFITTINKTVLARYLAIFAAEKILRIVPEGSHDWEKFVPPEDLRLILEQSRCHFTYGMYLYVAEITMLNMQDELVFLDRG